MFLPSGNDRYVVRMYRPWVTAARLADMQLVRRRLLAAGVPCSQPICTLDGASWISVDERLVEVELYVDHDARLDSWPRLRAGLPLLGRIHTLLRGLAVSEAGRNAPAANHIEPHEVLDEVQRGTRRLRAWQASATASELADAADELALLVDRAQQGFEELPRQLVHGDYWDNNVLFRAGRIVLVADFDFMGERARIDDLALTPYYTNATLPGDPVSDERIRQLRDLIDAYDSGLAEPLTQAERAALPVTLARTPLCFIAMIATADSELGARRLAAEMIPDVAWALGIMRGLDRWQSAFTHRAGRSPHGDG
jgi:homoserine kinase type II